MNKTFSALLVSTALTVPMAAMAQDAETACADLDAALSGDVSGNIDRERLAQVTSDGDGAICLVELEQLRQTAQSGNTDSTESDVSVADTAETTLTLQDEVTVQGRVLLEQTPPRVDIVEGEMNVEIEPGPSNVTVTEGQGEIVVRQAPANVTIDMPTPTITIEQAAPEIIITMPDPSVSVDSTQPTVRVVQADPVVSVTQAPAAVELELQRAPEGSEGTGFEVTDSRTGQAYQPGTSPEATTTEDAEVNLTASEPRVVLSDANEQAEVNIERSEPTIRFEQADPVVNFSTSGEPQVEFVQSGEPTVTFEQAAAETGASGEDATAQAAMSEQQAADAEAAEAETGEMPAAAETDADMEPVVDPAVTPGATATETAETEAPVTEAPVEATGPAVEREGYNLAQAGEYQVDALTGSTLHGVNDEQIGQIGEMVLSGGEVSEVIVEIGGFLGLGRTEVRIPFNRLSVLQSDSGDLRAYIDATEEELKAMPAAE